jgi:hypothetical protein
MSFANSPKRTCRPLAITSPRVFGLPGGKQSRNISLSAPAPFGMLESFNARLRDELLDGEIFYSLREARSWQPSAGQGQTLPCRFQDFGQRWGNPLAPPELDLAGGRKRASANQKTSREESGPVRGGAFVSGAPNRPAAEPLLPERHSRDLPDEGLEPCPYAVIVLAAEGRGPRSSPLP